MRGEKIHAGGFTACSPLSLRRRAGRSRRSKRWPLAAPEDAPPGTTVARGDAEAKTTGSRDVLSMVAGATFAVEAEGQGCAAGGLRPGLLR